MTTRHADLVNALRSAISALNATPCFDTRLPDPARSGRTMTSYQKQGK